MSRMERYYKVDEVANKRSNKNQDLYKSIYKLGEYSNIEGIATIDKSNEVDITKVKNMLKNREEYQRQKEIRTFTTKKQAPSSYEIYEPDEDRVYDIRDILEKAKINKPNKETYRSLNETDFEILKELKEKHNKKEEEENLKDLIDTISETSQLNKLSDHELGLDMFNTLKSLDNTTVQDRSSIRNILDEVKKEESKKIENTSNLDKSFFTSSLNFREDDFEQIKELNENVKKNNVLIRVLVFICLLIITAAIIYFVFNMIK